MSRYSFSFYEGNASFEEQILFCSLNMDASTSLIVSHAQNDLGTDEDLEP